MAYVVGLIATDGCLINTGRHLSFGSSDRALVETFLRCLGRSLSYQTLLTRAGSLYFRAQFGDVRFYRWLESIGLMQRKSLTLGAIEVPDEFVVDLARGLLDGDGSIINGVWRADTKDSRDYYWESLITQFISASRPHVEWLAAKIDGVLDIRGTINANRSKLSGRPIFSLRYGKPASVRLLGILYGDRDAPCLLRKRAIWDAYRSRHGLWTLPPSVGIIGISQSPSGVIG